MQALVEAARAPDYPAEIVAVLSNRPDAAGLGWARANDIKAIAIDHRGYSSKTEFESALQVAISEYQPDLIALAGFMRLLSDGFVESWHDRMLNIHPSLLPAFRGLNTHERAIEAGVRFSGCTVHLVRPEMDTGPIIAQASVPVLPSDTDASLAARVLDAEHVLYPHALALYASGAARVKGEKVYISEEFNYGEIQCSPPLRS